MQRSEQWPPTDVSVLLERVRRGEDDARGDLLDLVYDELRLLARSVMGGEGAGHTLQPTALVHEMWLKLAAGIDGVADRTHFFALAATAMRQVLADHAKAARRLKRGGGNARVNFHDGLTSVEQDTDLIALSDSLDRLRVMNERHARVLELRLFGGLTIAETAALLDVSTGTVKSDWVIARAWLGDELARN